MVMLVENFETPKKWLRTKPPRLSLVPVVVTVLMRAADIGLHAVNIACTERRIPSMHIYAAGVVLALLGNAVTIAGLAKEMRLAYPDPKRSWCTSLEEISYCARLVWIEPTTPGASGETELVELLQLQVDYTSRPWMGKLCQGPSVPCSSGLG
ncbi:unnamed protein product [Zymoseptoria tritici ST99CH_1A5]|nr:unnamed protein product [Zymoseptoria tritici ST99CH_3D1]SMY29132.1 unnamed protein product [Zymoseptoria tritici ST99CH_1A5]